MMRRIAFVLPFLLFGACAPEPEPMPAPAPEPGPTPTAQPAPAPAPAPPAQPAPATPAPGAQSEHEPAARRAAEAWIQQIDSGAYGQSWTDAAQMFRQAVTTEQWQQNAMQTRQQLGELQSRTFREAQFHTDLPNVPPGEYMILSYDARYASVDRPLNEQVVLTREQDGQWRVAGYFVR